MNTLESLFDEIEACVEQQQEQDEWEALAQAQFPALYETLVRNIRTLLKPLEQRLSKYAPSSIIRIWEVEEMSDHFKIRFGERILEFRSIGQGAKQAGDRFTVRILRKNEDLVGRIVPQLLHEGTDEMQWTVLGQGTRAERLDDQHLSRLLVDELLTD